MNQTSNVITMISCIVVFRYVQYDRQCLGVDERLLRNRQGEAERPARRFLFRHSRRCQESHSACYNKVGPCWTIIIVTFLKWLHISDVASTLRTTSSSSKCWCSLSRGRRGFPIAGHLSLIACVCAYVCVPAFVCARAFVCVCVPPCRMGNTPDSSSDNLGFRCARKASKTKSKTEL